MAGLLEKARSLLGGKDSSKVLPPFSTRCICGEVVHGNRRKDWQIVSCPACGLAVFVLPKSPLPEPSGLAVKTKRKKKATAADQQVNVSEETAAPAALNSATEVVTKPRVPLGRRLAGFAGSFIPPRRWFSTPRLVLLGSVLVVALTIWWSIHSAGIREMRERMLPNARLGMQALGEGRIDDAYKLLGKTVQALDRLNETIADEADYRQAYRELAIVNDLLNEPLDSALRNAKHDGGKALRDKALIIEADVSRDGAEWVVDFPMFIDNEPVTIHPSGLALFDQLGIRERSRLLFGARIESLVVAEGQTWLKLRPESGVLLTEPMVLDAVGLAALIEELGPPDQQNPVALAQKQKDMARKLRGKD